MITPILMPTWGLTMEEGTIVQWLIDEGAEITVGMELVEIETTKIANVLESQQAGILRRRIALPGATYACGQLIGVLADPETDDAEIEAFIGSFAEQIAKPDVVEEIGGPSHVDLPDGRTIRYLTVGDGGLPAVFIHGFGGDLTSWQFNQPIIAQDRTTYALDLPGHGGSSKELKDGSLSELVSGIVEALNLLQLEKFHLVGHSLGGAVAASIAIAMPDRVATLSLIAPAGLGSEIDTSYLKDFITAQRTRDLQRCLGRLFHDPAAVSRQMADDMAQYKRLDGVPQALQRIADNCLSLKTEDDHLRQISTLPMSVIVVWGKDDAILSSEALVKLPESMTRHELDEVGHMPQMEAAPRVNDLLKDHMAKGDCVT
jgi:pyruvate dehydrogenase E2 component (dihydrolipoamide acetyltransferase)